jgi:hypothetical protein
MEESVKHSIRKNGYPAKSVRLPFKVIYEACKKNETSIGDVLKNLENEGIVGAVDGDYILFKGNVAKVTPSSSTFNPKNPMQGEAFNMENFQKFAQEQMHSISPEQVEEIRNKVGTMSEEEKQKILQTFASQFKPGS